MSHRTKEVRQEEGQFVSQHYVFLVERGNYFEKNHPRLSKKILLYLSKQLNDELLEERLPEFAHIEPHPKKDEKTIMVEYGSTITYFNTYVERFEGKITKENIETAVKEYEFSRLYRKQSEANILKGYSTLERICGKKHLDINEVKEMLAYGEMKDKRSNIKMKEVDGIRYYHASALIKKIKSYKINK